MSGYNNTDATVAGEDRTTPLPLVNLNKFIRLDGGPQLLYDIFPDGLPKAKNGFWPQKFYDLRMKWPTKVGKTLCIALKVFFSLRANKDQVAAWNHTGSQVKTSEEMEHSGLHFMCPRLCVSP
ncbi:MAG: hypothetical protein PHI97_19925 [Desulfobulbus sp.]|nr:hypothetical protein [Desulfobulbus sp.]